MSEPAKTLKVCKIHRYNDLQKLAKPKIVHHVIPIIKLNRPLHKTGTSILSFPLHAWSLTKRIFTCKCMNWELPYLHFVFVRLHSTFHPYIFYLNGVTHAIISCFAHVLLHWCFLVYYTVFGTLHPSLNTFVSEACVLTTPTPSIPTRLSPGVMHVIVVACHHLAAFGASLFYLLLLTTTYYSFWHFHPYILQHFTWKMFLHFIMYSTSTATFLYCSRRPTRLCYIYI